MGKEGPQGGKGTWQRICSRFFSRHRIQLYSKGLRDPYRCRLFPHHHKQHNLRYRDPRGPRLSCSAHRRHVVRHHEPSGRRDQVCDDLWWCTEERRPCRRYILHREEGPSRKGEPLHPYNARPPHTHRRSFDVQHTSGILYLRDERDPQVAQGTRRCRGHVQDEPGEGSASLR